MFDCFNPDAQRHQPPPPHAAPHPPPHTHPHPAPPNGAPHPAADTNPDLLPPAGALAPMSRNVPQCPTLQKSAPPPAQPDGHAPSPHDLPDYQPAQPPAPDEPPLSDKQRQAI